MFVTHKYGFGAIEKWARWLTMALLKEKSFARDYDFLPLLDFALAFGLTDIKNRVVLIIKSRISNDKIDFAHLFGYAEERNHDVWKQILVRAYYHCTLCKTDKLGEATSISPRHQRMFEAARVKLTTMVAADFSWSHTCDAPKSCGISMKEFLDSSRPHYDGHPADFISWIQHVHKRSIKMNGYGSDCHRLGISTYVVQAGNFQLGLWDFYKDLEH